MNNYNFSKNTSDLGNESVLWQFELDGDGFISKRIILICHGTHSTEINISSSLTSDDLFELASELKKLEIESKSL